MSEHRLPRPPATTPAPAKSPVRIFECNQYVTSFLEGGIDDWPAQIQDQLYAAMEAKAKEVQLPLAVVASWCDFDFDSKPHVRVILSEIVAAKDGIKGGYLYQ